MLRGQLFARKTVDQCIADSEVGGGMRRTLGAVQLTALGIGAIIGAGIFAAIGTAISGDAGHVGAGAAIVVSIVLAGVTSALAAITYSEFAAMIPISGSAYTYAYATLGELVAWIIGWDLILEYAVGNIAVAIGWAGCFDSLLRGLGVELPRWLVTDILTARHNPALLASVPHLGPIPLVFNLPAFGIVAIITWLLVIGTKETAWVNTLMVVIKVAIIGLFLVVGIAYVKPQQWSTPAFAPNGLAGISVGAAIIFFSYIGFDAVSTAAEEARNPQRDIPRGIIWSLIICTVLYVGIAFVLTGIIPWDKLNVPDPLAVALQYIHADWAAGVLALGAVAAMTSVLLVFQLGQARIFMSMARDGLLPPWAARLHPRYKTPHVTTIVTGIFVALFAAIAPIGVVLELTNIGTLFAFILVALGIIVLRRTDPKRPRPFRTPWVPLLPIVSILFCVYLIVSLPTLTKVRFVAWLVAGAVIYFLYSVRHSRVRREGEVGPRVGGEPA
ncbi:MAG: amino acid permease [Gemmatimonadetes bacterium 13_2_20CM_2_65_7]|nr:MAG: amino acid permease [Gemmatimonadetes bacterium 13_2_20CM_2_65_7]